MKKLNDENRRDFVRKEFEEIFFTARKSFNNSNPISVHAESTSNFNRTFKIYLSREAVSIFSNRFYYCTVCVKGRKLKIFVCCP
jgi:hypothetical protein